MQNIPNKDSFELLKVKITKSGLDVHYELTEVVGSEAYTNRYHVESEQEIHPDLRKGFKDLEPIMGRILGLTSFLSMMEAEPFKATKSQTEQARGFADNLMGRLEVRGISLSGSGDNRGVVISGQLSVDNGQQTAVNSPRMKFGYVAFGFEEELERIVTLIEDEVYESLFNGKKAQLELFGE